MPDHQVAALECPRHSIHSRSPSNPRNRKKKAPSRNQTEAQRSGFGLEKEER